jgi:hypothetical protein
LIAGIQPCTPGTAIQRQQPHNPTKTISLADAVRVEELATRWVVCLQRMAHPVSGGAATRLFASVSLSRGGWGILVLDDVTLGWGEDGWIGIALVKLLDLGGGSASPGIVADRHHGDVEIS